MLIPPRVSMALIDVFVELRSGERRPVGTATAFQQRLEPILNPDVVSVPGSLSFAVTARHVVEQAKRISATGVLSLRMPFGNPAPHFVEVPFDAWVGHEEDANEPWLDETQELRKDVALAVLPDDVVLMSEIYPLTWAPELVKHSADEIDPVAPGQDVAVLGLFNSYVGSTVNSPVVRAGIVSALPGEPLKSSIGSLRGYLVEVRSTGGLSGAPVFWAPGRYRFGDSGVINEVEIARFSLLGIIHGHFDDYIATEPVNKGMAIVTPVDEICDIVSQSTFRRILDEAESSWREQIRNGDVYLM